MKKIKLLLFIGLISMFASCNNDNNEIYKDYSIAQSQLMVDYKSYVLGRVSWMTQGGYKVGQFYAQTSASATTKRLITVWYSINGETATREMDNQYLGTTVPEELNGPYVMSQYGDDSQWSVDAVALNNNYNGNGYSSYYTIEFDNVSDPDIEAKAYFEATKYFMIFDEQWDDDIDDKDDNTRMVLTEKMAMAANSAHPGSEILDAYLNAQSEDNIIELNAVIVINNDYDQINLSLNSDYEVIFNTIEQDITYGNLAPGFVTLKDWFNNNTQYPTPPSLTAITFTVGYDTSLLYDLDYYFNVEFNDYSSYGKKYALQFFLDYEYNIVGVVSNGELL